MSFSKFIGNNERTIRLAAAAGALVGAGVLFGAKPAGWLETVVRITAGTCALLLFVLRIADIYRETRQHRRSPKSERLAKVAAVALWACILLVVVLALIMIPA